MRLPIRASEIEENITDVSYDAIIGAVGYEQRAPHIAQQSNLASIGVKVACAFREPRGGHFDANLAWFDLHEFDVFHASDFEFEGWLRSVVLEKCLSLGRDNLRIAIDISCFNRYRLACLVEFLAKPELECITETDFWYAIAKFDPPGVHEELNTLIGPINSRFGGWFVDSDRPTIGILGLGYEDGKALGAVEHLEISDIWCWLPDSPIPEYLPEVRQANRVLLSEVPTLKHVMYSLSRPAETLTRLVAMASNLSAHNNVMLLPFGPKMFSLVSILVSLIQPAIAVWRVSAKESLSPVNRVASGRDVGLRIGWRK